MVTKMPLTMLQRVAMAIAETQVGHWEYWYDFKPEARAALEAMREPTQEMLRDYYPDAHETVVSEWKVMIDAALKEGQAGS